MQQRAFGHTGLQVTPIGLGLAALGRPGYINLGHSGDLHGEYDESVMEAHSHTVLDAAWNLGIRYFDAARSYGKAEDFLGSWLQSRAIDPTTVSVGSKWGYIYTADWKISAEKHEIKEHSLDNLNRQIEESLSHLSPFLQLYQIHSATRESGVLENQPVLERLGELRDQGLIIGLSLSGPNQADVLRQAMSVSINNRPLFGEVQATWNLLSQEVGAALNEAHLAGMGVIVKEALANGRLTPRNSESEFRPQLERLTKAAAAHDTTIDALAIAGVLAQPWVDCVLSGATTVEQLTSNVAALKLDWSDELEELGRSLTESPEAYWATRSRLAWN
ncbi:MAG: aldo/keto reductase [Chloroflexota bacterium]